MKKLRWMIIAGSALLGAACLLEAGKVDKGFTSGPDAFVGATDLKAGTFRRITAADLKEPTQPKPFPGRVQARPEGVMPQAPAGFKVELYAKEGLRAPRQIRRAPNGDLFVAETNSGEIKVIRDNGGKPQISIFATGFRQPFGVNFYPPGANPQFVYVGNTGSIVRFAYKTGDLKASGSPETLINDIPAGGNHFTRDVIFSKDGRRMFVSVGSADNVSDNQVVQEHRANILEYTPDGKFVQIYASGIRNPVGIELNPTTNEIWTSVNERDNLGDNLVPDYITSVKEGGFYGWPWFYIGKHEDNRAKMARPADKTIDKVTVPDVLVTPHSASLGLTFYDGTAFPGDYRGDLFACEHGSWNRSQRAGLEVVRVPLEKGKSNGVFQDFLTGFALPDGNSWGRPVGVVTGKDGALYVTDDGYGAIWRVSYTK